MKRSNRHLVLFFLLPDCSLHSSSSIHLKFILMNKFAHLRYFHTFSVGIREQRMGENGGMVVNPDPAFLAFISTDHVEKGFSLPGF